VRKKSLIVAFILATFFGPLGLIYASIPGGIVLTNLAIMLGMVTTFALGSLLVLPFSALWALISTVRYNRFVEKAKRRVADLCAEIKEIKSTLRTPSSPTGGPAEVKRSLKEQAAELRRQLRSS